MGFDFPPGLQPRALCRLIAWLVLALSTLWATPVLAAPAQRTLAQSTPGATPQLYLLPAGGTDVILETHLADLRLDGGSVVMDASYRLRNPTNGPVTLGLRLASGGDLSLSDFQGLFLTADGQGLPLQPSGDGGYTSQVAIPADGRVLLRLGYQVSLGNNALATVRYAPAVLNQWPGNISLRVQLVIGEGLPTDAWMEVAPDGWTYGVPAHPTETSIKWLYDANIPDTAFVFRLIAPATWAQLQEAKSAAVDGAPQANFVRLGNLYRQLYREAPSNTLRNRFYAQAVAAYTAGLTKAAPGAAPQDQAALHIGLAHLYRERVVEADSATYEQYARLVVDEVTAALALLPADDPQRAELERWQVDGLRVLLNAHYAQQDWPGALAIIDQLAALPPGAIDPTFVAEERRAILVQQGLQFMQQGNREAAMAVAGNQIAAEGLTPPPESYPLFAAWQITVTAGPEQLHLETFALTPRQRHEEAHAALQEVVQLWEEGVTGAAESAGGDYTFILENVEPPHESGLPTGLRLRVEFPLSANGLLLAQLLPPRIDWALLHTVLSQLAPTSERANQLIWQQVTLSQPLDLRSGAARWLGVAEGLEQQANELEAAGSATDTSNVSGAEAQLRARIQAVNYRAAADEWRNLAEQSWLLFTFQVEDPVFETFNQEAPSRSWYATAGSPSQTFLFQTQVVNLNRVLALLLVGFAGLVGAAGVLWSLL